MYLLISIVHVIVCMILILVILLQAGKGGGLSEMFGGAMTQNEKLFGAETNNFLKMATSYAAIIFIITCILLGILTANQGRSLVENLSIQPVMNGNAATAEGVSGSQAPAASAPASASTAIGAGAAVVTEAAAAATQAVAPAQETAPAAAQ